MGIELITLAIVVALFSLMAIGVPLGASTLLISVTAAYMSFGSNGFILVTSAVTKVMDKQALIAVPFFVFMANVMERSGVARELFNSMAILGCSCAVAWRCKPVWSQSSLPRCPALSEGRSCCWA